MIYRDSEILVDVTRFIALPGASYLEADYLSGWALLLRSDFTNEFISAAIARCEMALLLPAISVSCCDLDCASIFQANSR